jgi:hypothetical protein
VYRPNPGLDLHAVDVRHIDDISLSTRSLGIISEIDHNERKRMDQLTLDDILEIPNSRTYFPAQLSIVGLSFYLH